ncbi:hypothetical protein HUG12_12805 [Halorarum salinum]|uniref:Glycosyltransferase RgtA/B/C/D-like domain-containing protein n=1 Tax=Halorarum salinum TaxID=2743089 RepID=A0A7D5LC68_9EURY|nr:hypothetical protein [Halobaculum salinum]QLG62555.1 hypothetical protein HUG12_12805 [Halobaculum salinum]
MATIGDLRAPTKRDVTVTAVDAVYLFPGLAASTLVYAAYLSTHPLPSYGAGLFFAMAEAVSGNGYLPPETVRGYTADGVPFAYPPLAIYALAVVRDATGVDALTQARFLPGLVSTLAVVPTYFLSRALLDTRPRAALATVLTATSPPVLQWHLSAGGVVRAPAYLLLLSGLYAAVRLFGDRNRSWLWPATGLFGLTVLTHPLYAAAFALSCLWLYVALDGTRRGLGDGTIVAGGGLVLASPWLATVAANHGLGTLAAAAGTHGGIGGRLVDLLAGRDVASILFSPPGSGTGSPAGQLVLWVWLALVIAAFAYTLRERGPLLPGWFLVIGATLWKGRFVFLLGAMVTAFATADGFPRLLGGSDGVRRERVAVAAAVVLAVTSVAVGGLYAAGAVQTHPGNPSQPQYIDEADVEAMEAVAATTDPDATFVVLGDAAEWFPYLTDRTILSSHWGVEWHGADEFTRQFSLQRRISRCPTGACITERLRENRVEPDFLYVPTDAYTVNGVVYRPEPGRVAALVAADRYRLVYRNEGVAVVAVDHGGDPSAPASATSTLPSRPLEPSGKRLAPEGPPDERATRGVTDGVGSRTQSRPEGMEPGSRHLPAPVVSAPDRASSTQEGRPTEETSSSLRSNESVWVRSTPLMV